MSPFAAAEVVLPCEDLDAGVAFFTDLGFGLRAIFPADAPRVAVVAGHGLRLRLERDRGGSPGVIRLPRRELAAGGARELVAPNGTRVELVEAEPALALPPLRPSFVVTRLTEGSWGAGRAGMRYRDLIPDRQGGRFIASHIQIPAGGPVPDYVHYHRVRFQMIFCARGWVRVVYEDQGPPFVLQAGDCVLQPPLVRHRVLESSPGLEVVELGCPAEHETLVDPELELPTGALDPTRDFSGQRFVRHVAAEASWRPWASPGFEARDTGIGAATGGLAGARVVRPAAGEPTSLRHEGELWFGFLLSGGLTLQREGQDPVALDRGDAVVVPPGEAFSLRDPRGELELLEVTLPADGKTTGPGDSDRS